MTATTKIAVVILADTKTEEGLGRAYNALMTAKEFHDAGESVRVYLDGAGTRWPAELAKPDHIAHALYEEVKPLVAGACGGCAAVFGATEGVQSEQVKLLDEFGPGVSYRDMLTQGYQVLTF
ncbi:hypothetical protein Dcar01_03830 [Deinococcus carri]|uniref:DsrE/DsrF-like family protein n=1 Tax=Deinococcus carri TaxID=1211323 RepID=A0ABP9WD41_9DEIO